MLYFAYGSKLNWDQMRERCPSAKFICVAGLPEHRLAFTRTSVRRGCGVVDAVPDQGQEVWGVVYEISQAEVGSLDAAEGFSPGRAQNAYAREERQVLVGEDTSQSMTVWVYFAHREDNPPLPNAEYRSILVESAKYWRLPAHYIAALEGIAVSG